MTANGRSGSFGLAAALLALVAVLWATEGRGAPAKIGDYNPADQTVEMFAAIKKGDIAVKLVPKNSTQCQVLIENKTDKPLNVKLPAAFAGVPAVAQVGGAGGAGRRSSTSSNRSSGNQQQSTGGGMGGMGGGGGMGMFNIPPEKVGRLNVPTVCLEHGKVEPRAAVPYEIKPLDNVTSKPGVRELCEALGSGQMNQRAAQAAAWHLNNGMSWDELTAKRLRHANGTSQPYFTAEEIQGGIQIAAAAVRTAEERQSQNAGSSQSAGGK